MVAIDSPAYLGGLEQPSIRPYSSEDYRWAIDLLEGTGGRYRVRRGKAIDTAVLPGLVGSRGGRPSTFVAISRTSADHELTVIASNPFDEELVQLVIQAAIGYRKPECRRAYAITTNAQFEIQRALQQSGFRMCSTRPGSVESLTRRSPYPIITDFDGIEVRDEVEFDLFLT